jgi:hypothetical protein
MTAETLLNDLRALYRRHPTENTPGEFRRAAGAYQAALAVLNINERQRKNVYEQTLYTGITLDAAIIAARRRENTRTVWIDSDGIRIESVREMGSEHFRVEVYDTATGEMVASSNGLPTERVERTATDLFTEVWNHRNTGPECDECLVRPDGTRDDGATCPCSVRAPAGGCRCQASPAEWHGPAYVRAELAASEA